MLWIWDRNRKGMAKDRLGFFEADIVFPEILLGLLFVPFRGQAHVARPLYRFGGLPGTRSTGPAHSDCRQSHLRGPSLGRFPADTGKEGTCRRAPPGFHTRLLSHLLQESLILVVGA